MKLPGVSIFKRGGPNKARRPWQIAYGFGSKRVVVTGSTDWEDTVELAKKLSRLAQKQKMGLTTDDRESREEVQRRRSLTDHLNEYEKAIKSQGKGKTHAAVMRLYAEESLEQYATIDGLVSSEIQHRISKLKTSAKTKNRRMYAVMNFLRWGKSDGRWPQSVVDRCNLVRLAESRTKKRRVLAMDELAKLIDVAENSPTIAGMPGKDRALLYRFMLASGLRLGETSRITLDHLADDGLDIPGALTKNKKGARIKLPTTLIAQLRDLAAGRRPEEPIFAIPSNPHRVLKADLKTAGIQRQTSAGVFDFHSIRHQCATILASAGAPAKAIQEHMRHGSMKTTMDIYAHLFDQDRTQASELLAKVIQRPQQRAISQGSAFMSQNQWSHRESNPDLLNAIQPSSR